MVFHIVFPNIIGPAFGPDVRLLNGFALAADPLGHLLVWIQAFLTILAAGTDLGRLISRLALTVRFIVGEAKNDDIAGREIVVATISSRRG